MTYQIPPKGRTFAREEDDMVSIGDSARGRWLSINEACAMLGVDQSTLRRWSDAGKVPVFRTPGGHRRYAEGDLRNLVGESARRPDRPKIRQEMTDRSLSAFEEVFWQGARARRWFRAFSPSKHDELRLLGRRLVDLAVRFASSPESADRSSLLDEGRQIGEQYGSSSARAGLTSLEAVEAFLYFRSPVVRSVVSMIEDQGLAIKRAARVFVDIGQFLDQVLLAMVGAHDSTEQVMGIPLPHTVSSADMSSVGDA
jgi:excisionase family DNA binding protein